MSKYFIPTTISKYRINDVFYSDTGRLTIIVFATSYQPIIQLVEVNTKQQIILNKTVCTHGHACIYTMETIMDDKPSEIQLAINDEIVTVHVNTYPQFPGEIIMSTLVKNEDNYLKQWIDYHLRLGVTRFVIYDNDHTMRLDTILSEYIENEIVVLIKWSYQYHLEKAQMTQQDHSIYAFQKSKYIGLLDIDEYVNIQKKIKIDDFFNELIESNNNHHYSGFQFLNRFFFNPDNLPTHDLHFLQCFECDNLYIGGREKCFVVPNRVKSYSVHTVTDESLLYVIDGTKAFFNHYFFLNKHGRGRNRTGMTDNSILLHLQ